MENDMENDVTTTGPFEAARKDEYFGRLSVLSEEMIRDFGRDFAMGALVLAARYIAERAPAEAAQAAQGVNAAQGG